MYKQVIFALFVSIAFIDYVNGSCRDRTYDECDYGENGPFESYKGIYLITLIVFMNMKIIISLGIPFELP